MISLLLTTFLVEDEEAFTGDLAFLPEGDGDVFFLSLEGGRGSARTSKAGRSLFKVG